MFIFSLNNLFSSEAETQEAAHAEVMQKLLYLLLSYPKELDWYVEEETLEPLCPGLYFQNQPAKIGQPVVDGQGETGVLMGFNPEDENILVKWNCDGFTTQVAPEVIGAEWRTEEE